MFFFGPKKIRFTQIELVLLTKNRSEPAKNRFSVALLCTIGVVSLGMVIRMFLVNLFLCTIGVVSLGMVIRMFSIQYLENELIDFATFAYALILARSKGC